MRPKSVPMASVRSNVSTVGGRAGLGVRRPQRLEARPGRSADGRRRARARRRQSPRARPAPRGQRRRCRAARSWVTGSTPVGQPLADRVGVREARRRASGRARLEAGGDRPVDQRASEDLVQHLRRRGAHARALTGGEENTGEWRAVSHAGVGGRCWELGRLDSNQGSRDQNPLPYHLATPHRARSRGARSSIRQAGRHSMLYRRSVPIRPQLGHAKRSSRSAVNDPVRAPRELGRSSDWRRTPGTGCRRSGVAVGPLERPSTASRPSTSARMRSGSAPSSTRIARRNAAVLADEAEQQVLGADGPVVERGRLLTGQREDPPRMRRERELAEHRNVASPDGAARPGRGQRLAGCRRQLSARAAPPCSSRRSPSSRCSVPT